MKWLSMSKWRNCTSPPAVTDAFHSSSGELTDASSAAPWSPSYASSNSRSSSSLSTGSSSGSSTTGSPTAASSRSSFVKRMFSRMGRAGGDGGAASPRAGSDAYSSGRKRPRNPYAADGHDEDYDDDFAAAAAADDEFSHTSLWQRSILRGERCEAPAFSGLILYDAAGNRISQLPAKSPLHPALVPPALD